MSSKTERRRRQFEAREKRREFLSKPWRCSCGELVEPVSPICLCGNTRPKPPPDGDVW